MNDRALSQLRRAKSLRLMGQPDSLFYICYVSKFRETCKCRIKDECAHYGKYEIDVDGVSYDSAPYVTLVANNDY